MHPGVARRRDGDAAPVAVAGITCRNRVAVDVPETGNFVEDRVPRLIVDVVIGNGHVGATDVAPDTRPGVVVDLVVRDRQPIVVDCFDAACGPVGVVTRRVVVPDVITADG